MKKLLVALRAYTKAATASPEAAKQALLESGIYLPDGTLAPEYTQSKPKNDN